MKEFRETVTDTFQPRRFAALDLGSLTVRLAVAERTPAGKTRVLVHRREITALGQGLAATNDLAPEGMARTLAALKTFQQVMTAHNVTVWRAVGTQALRQARNRQFFLDRVRDTLGLAVEVLAPETEARLSLTGVLTTLAPEALTGADVLVFDVGGGSSEFALVRPGQKPVFASLPLGVLTLSQARPLGDPPMPEKVAALKEELAARLASFYKKAIGPYLEGDPCLVGTAGAVTTLAAMQLKLRAYDAKKINNLISDPGPGGGPGRTDGRFVRSGAGPFGRDRARQGRGHGGRGLDRIDYPGDLPPGFPGGDRRRAPGRGLARNGPQVLSFGIRRKRIKLIFSVNHSFATR